MIAEDGENETEIKRRIEIVRSAFYNMSKILTSQSIDIETKRRLVKCYTVSGQPYCMGQKHGH